MGSDGTVSRWISEMREGSDLAAEALWNHYWTRLRAVSKRSLTGMRLPLVDDEDIALAAFHSFLRRSRRGEYPHVNNRDEAWRLLVVVAVRKAMNFIRDERCARRNPRTRADQREPDSAFPADAPDGSLPPDVAVMISDSVEHLLQLLDDDELREIAMAKLAGYTNHEIAETLHRSVATIERRLRLIRVRWQRENL